MHIEYFDIDGTVIEYAVMAWGIVQILRAIFGAINNFSKGKKK